MSISSNSTAPGHIGAAENSDFALSAPTSDGEPPSWPQIYLQLVTRREQGAQMADLVFDLASEIVALKKMLREKTIENARLEQSRNRHLAQLRALLSGRTDAEERWRVERERLGEDGIAYGFEDLEAAA